MRAPMHDAEEPAVRPYLLVDDIAHPPMELPGHGTLAIYIQGGIEHRLWQT